MRISKDGLSYVAMAFCSWDGWSLGINIFALIFSDLLHLLLLYLLVLNATKWASYMLTFWLWLRVQACISIGPEDTAGRFRKQSAYVRRVHDSLKCLLGSCLAIGKIIWIRNIWRQSCFWAAYSQSSIWSEASTMSRGPNSCSRNVGIGLANTDLIAAIGRRDRRTLTAQRRSRSCRVS